MILTRRRRSRFFVSGIALIRPVEWPLSFAAGAINAGPVDFTSHFLSSTFRDMHAERDYLRTHVFPQLEERLQQRRHHLEPIDLRWGVETVTVDEQQSKELLVLKVCLNKINRSRPFLIGLIDDRYGWIPPEDRIQAAVEEVGFKPRWLVNV